MCFFFSQVIFIPFLFLCSQFSILELGVLCYEQQQKPPITERAGSTGTGTAEQQPQSCASPPPPAPGRAARPHAGMKSSILILLCICLPHVAAQLAAMWPWGPASPRAIRSTGKVLGFGVVGFFSLRAISRFCLPLKPNLISDVPVAAHFS